MFTNFSSETMAAEARGTSSLKDEGEKTKNNQPSNPEFYIQWKYHYKKKMRELHFQPQ